MFIYLFYNSTWHFPPMDLHAQEAIGRPYFTNLTELTTQWAYTRRMPRIYNDTQDQLQYLHGFVRLASPRPNILAPLLGMHVA